MFGLTFSGVIKSTFFPNIPFDKLNLEVAFKPGEREMQSFWRDNDILLHNDRVARVHFSIQNALSTVLTSEKYSATVQTYRDEA